MKLPTIIAFALMASVAAGSSVQQLPSTRSLEDDFEEFIELVPIDKIIDVALRYFLTDKDVQAAVQYILGPEFATIWDQVFALKEVRDILDYLKEAGVDAYAFFNDVAGLIGVNPVKPIRAYQVNVRGLNDFINEVLALLPEKDLLALFEHKLETSVEFKAFFEMIKNTEFNKLVEFANGSAELQSLLQKLRDHGVDVDKFFELVKGFFGWGF